MWLFRGVDRKVGPLVIIEDLLMLLGALLIYFTTDPAAPTATYWNILPESPILIT